MATRTGPDEVLDAAVACIARVGLTKTTLDDVARTSGCARATVYRHFPGKQPLFAALFRREAGRLVADLVARGRAAESLSDAVVAVVTTGAHGLQAHPALAFVVAHEPDVLLPYLAFERESAFLGASAELIAPAFTTFLPESSATRLAEWLTRITQSFLCSPSEHFDVLDPVQVRALVDDFVLPGFTRAGAEYASSLEERSL